MRKLVALALVALFVSLSAAPADAFIFRRLCGHGACSIGARRACLGERRRLIRRPFIRRAQAVQVVAPVMTPAYPASPCATGHCPL